MWKCDFEIIINWINLVYFMKVEVNNTVFLIPQLTMTLDWDIDHFYVVFHHAA